MFDEPPRASLTNTLSKRIDELAWHDGLMLVALEVSDRTAEGWVSRCNTQEFTNAAGAFSKLVEEQPYQHALVAIAVEMQHYAYAGMDDMREFHDRRFASLTNALSKMVDDNQCRLALVALAGDLKNAVNESQNMRKPNGCKFDNSDWRKKQNLRGLVC